MKLSNLLLAVLLIAASHLPAAAHTHLFAGAVDSNGNGVDASDPLGFISPALTSFPLTVNGVAGFTGDPTFAYTGGDPTFTSLTQGTDPTYFGGFNPSGATQGSFLQLSLYSVTGPAGGVFAVYDSVDDVTNLTPAFTLATGQSGGTGMFALTEQDYFDAGDTYGHIHGRVFAVNLPGVYQVSWILKDTSAIVSASHPFDHPDSAIFTTTFTAAAVPEPSTVGLLATATIIGAAWRRRRLSS